MEKHFKRTLITTALKIRKVVCMLTLSTLLVSGCTSYKKVPYLQNSQEVEVAAGEIEVPVKMLVTRARTERPHGALLQFDTGIRYCMYRIGGRRRRMDASLSGVAVGIPPL